MAFAARGLSAKQLQEQHGALLREAPWSQCTTAGSLLTALAERRPPIVVFGASRGPVLFHTLVVPKAFGLVFYLPGVTASHADLVGPA